MVTDAHHHDEVSARVDRPEWEAANLHTLAVALTTTALARTESRGGHVRRDFPAADPAWRRHLLLQARPDGELVLTPEDV